MSHDLHDRVSYEIARRIAAGLPRILSGYLNRWSQTKFADLFQMM